MKLIVITTKFPYSNTEAFLESEYPFLQKKFDKVIFLPLIKGELRKKCEDAKICDVYANQYKDKKNYIFKVLFSCNFYSSLWRHRTKIFERHRITNIFKQEFHYQIFKKIVSKFSFLFDSNTIVYSYWFNAPVYSMLKLRKEFGLKCKVVCRAHRFDVYDDNGEMPNRAYCIDAIDKIFPISQDAINVFTSKYGHDDKFVLSRLGVKDFYRISPQSAPNSFHILSVSQVHPRKRIHKIFESVIIFAKKYHGKSVTWTHFGDGVQLKDLLLWAKNHNIPNLTIEVKGRVPNTDILRYISETALDVFINLSSSEGVPVSIMEAQSFGLPVIATDVGGTREILDVYSGVLLSSSPSTLEVVRAMETIIKKNFNRSKIKESWKAIADADVNFKFFVDNLMNL